MDGAAELPREAGCWHHRDNDPGSVGAPRASGKGLAGRIAGHATACGDRTEPGAAPEHRNAYNFLFYSEFLTLQSLKQSFIGEWTARFGEDAFVQFGMFG